MVKQPWVCITNLACAELSPLCGLFPPCGQPAVQTTAGLHYALTVGPHVRCAWLPNAHAQTSNSNPI